MPKNKWYVKVIGAVAALVLALGLSLVPAQVVKADHTATVTLAPSVNQGGAEITFTLTVENTGGDDITEVTLDVPPPGTGSSNYDVTWIDSDILPWVAEYTSVPFGDGSRADVITWSGGTIPSGESVTFTFKAIAPAVETDYQWDWTTTDAVAGTDSGTVTSTVDNTPPFLVDLVTGDDDGNGQIDTLVATFSEDLQGTFDGTGFTVSGYTIASATQSASNIITFSLDELESPDTGATPTLSYDGTAGIADLAGNALASFSQAATDEAAPVLVGLVTGDDNGNGQIDTLVATFSEDLQGTFDGTGFTVSGYTIASASETADGVITFTLNESGSADTDATPTLSYDDTVGDITDLPMNALASFTDAASTDQAGPVLLSITWDDVDDDGNVSEGDQLVFLFSEPMDTETITAENIDSALPTSGGTTYGTSPTLSWNESQDILTVALGAGTDIDAAADTVNPANTVLDAVGNADATLAGVGIVQVSLSIEAPSTVLPVEEFTVRVNISEVEGFDTGQFTVNYEPAVLEYVSVSDGLIGSTTVPVDLVDVDEEGGAVSIIVNVGGVDGATGSGYLCELTFRGIGVSGSSSALTIADGYQLADSNENLIVANTFGASVQLLSSVLGDANGDGVVSMTDVTRVERIILGLADSTPEADANDDDSVDVRDITRIEKIILGIEE